MPTVEDVMMTTGPEVVIAPADTTVSTSATMMADAGCGSIIVMEGSEIKGIFTERDLLKKVVAKGLDPLTTTLAEVMSNPVLSCSLEDEVDKCWEIMSENHIRHVAVIEGGALVGVIGLRDILRLQHRCQHPEGRLCEAQPWPRDGKDAKPAKKSIKVIEL